MWPHAQGCAHTERQRGSGFMVGARIKSAWRRLHGGLALIRCYEVLRSLHGLDIHWNGSQGPPQGHAVTQTDRQEMSKNMGILTLISAQLVICVIHHRHRLPLGSKAYRACPACAPTCRSVLLHAQKSLIMMHCHWWESIKKHHGSYGPQYASFRCAAYFDRYYDKLKASRNKKVPEGT